MRKAALLALALGLAVAACGLGRSGLGPEDLGDPPGSGEGGHTSGSSGASAAGDAAGASGSSGGAGDAGAGESGPSPSCVTTAGWNAVFYELTRAACPAGSGAAHDELSAAIAGPGACGCSCTITAQPTCEQGTLSTHWAQQGPFPPGVGCMNPGSAMPVKGSGCVAFANGGAQLAGGFSAPALQPSAGACTAALAVDPGAVTKTAVRMCDVPSSDLDAVCSGAPPTGFAACITAPGDVPCPSGPFILRTVIADDDVLVCPACSACQVAASCGGAQVTFYSDDSCGQVVATLPANGACMPTGEGAGQDVSSYEYTAQVQASCQAVGAGAPAFDPVAPHTVCCR